MTEMSITAQIEALRWMSRGELIRRYEELFGHEPRLSHKQWLFKRCAWKTQERHYGGLSPAAKEKLEGLISQVKFPLGRRRTIAGKISARTSGNLAVGTVLRRMYRGEEICVTVVENGIEWEGVVYGSLSAVARAVTGSRWNGPLFFGLSTRKKKS
jgi:hypothetical protein